MLESNVGRALRAVISCWALVACGEAPGAASQGPTAGTTDGAGSSTGDPAAACGGLGAAGCSPELICDALTCGGKTSVINHEGCPRRTCSSNADCDEGWRCYPLVLGAVCLSSGLDCSEQDGSCSCGSTDDCGGVVQAHCLPDAVYPPADDCDPAAIGCDALGSWQEAMLWVAGTHAEAGASELAAQAIACSVTAASARVTCGESPCEVLCALAPCDPGGAACVAACEAVNADAPTLQDVLAAVAAAPDRACDCTACDATGTDLCAQVWAC